MANIFVYGTLQSPELVQKLTGRTFKSTPAVLPGYKKFCIRDADYPAIIQQENCKTDGMLLEDMDDKSLKLLSFYEGDQYEKIEVSVLSNGKLIKGLAFVWIYDHDFLEDKNWSLQEFEKHSLKEYLQFVVPETRESFFRK